VHSNKPAKRPSVRLNYPLRGYNPTECNVRKIIKGTLCQSSVLYELTCDKMMIIWQARTTQDVRSAKLISINYCRGP